MYSNNLLGMKNLKYYINPLVSNMRRNVIKHCQDNSLSIFLYCSDNLPRIVEGGTIPIVNTICNTNMKEIF